MKKFKFSAAILAAVFAFATAFTAKPEKMLISGYFANKDLDPDTEQIPALDDQSEVDINSEVTSTLSIWANLHCTNPSSLTCAVQIVNNAIQQRFSGDYHN